MRANVEHLQQQLSDTGASLEDVRLPHAAEITAIYLAIVFGEAAGYHGVALESHASRYQPGVRLRLEAARFVLAEDYLRARRGREVIRAEVDAALDGRDVLLAPALPIEAPSVGAGTVIIAGTPYPVRNVMLRLTQPFNISGHPAVTIPCGPTTRGLPCGVQLIGRPAAPCRCSRPRSRASLTADAVFPAEVCRAAAAETRRAAAPAEYPAAAPGERRAAANR